MAKEDAIVVVAKEEGEEGEEEGGEEGRQEHRWNPPVPAAQAMKEIVVWRRGRTLAGVTDQVHVEAKGSVVFAYRTDTNGKIVGNRGRAMLGAIRRILKARVEE